METTIEIKVDTSSLAIPGYKQLLEKEYSEWLDILTKIKRAEDNKTGFATNDTWWKGIFEKGEWAPKTRAIREAADIYWRTTSVPYEDYGLAHACRAILSDNQYDSSVFIGDGGFPGGWDYGTTVALCYPEDMGEEKKETLFNTVLFGLLAIKAHIRKDWKIYISEESTYEGDSVESSPCRCIHFWQDARDVDHGWKEFDPNPNLVL